MASSSEAPKVTLSEEETETVEKTCRLCWGDEDEGPLVQPCACRGSAKWIHQHCLEQWRRKGPRKDAAYRCGQCMDQYCDALSLELLNARLLVKRRMSKTGQSTISTLNALAWELKARGQHDEAEPLKVARETLGYRHQSTIATTSNLGGLLQAKGDLTAAEALRREALEAARETLGSRHPETLLIINHLGGLLQAKGDLAAADPLYREALVVRRETLGNRHPSTLNSIENLGGLLQDKGDLAAAEPLLREALEVRRETLGDRHLSTLLSVRNLGLLSKALLLQKMGDLTVTEG